jgi:hypothetical protein
LSGTFSKVHGGISVYTPQRPNNCNSELEKPIKAPSENFSIAGNVGVSELEQSKRHRIESEMQEGETIEKSVDVSDKGSSRFEKTRRRLFEPGTPENGPHVRSSDLCDWVNERSEEPSGFGNLPDCPTPRRLTETSVATQRSLDNVSIFVQYKSVILCLKIQKYTLSM